MRQIVKRSIRQAGYGRAELVEATSAEEAAIAICEEAPDLVLLDVNMPGQNGLAMVELLQEQDLEFRFGLVTAERSEGVLTEAAALGAEFIIHKPSTVDLLSEALQSVFD